MRYFLFTDGASRGNPGPAAAGIVLKNSEGKTVGEKSQFLGRMTNNEAEYRALILGLAFVKSEISEEAELVVLMDSELVVSQIEGVYKIKAAHLKQLSAQVKEEVKNFSKVTFKLVPREKNIRADALANKALNNAGA